MVYCMKRIFMQYPKEAHVMPIRIPNNLPAREVLESENIFVMPETRAESQQIRPLRMDC